MLVKRKTGAATYAFVSCPHDHMIRPIFFRADHIYILMSGVSMNSVLWLVYLYLYILHSKQYYSDPC